MNQLNKEASFKEYATLNNGTKIFMLGYGVFQIPSENTKRCVLDAISMGYCSIDIAQGYYNRVS